MGYNRVLREVVSRKGKEIYNVTLTFDDDGNLLLHKSSCTCIFGSWWRFAGIFRKKGTLCWHMIKVIQDIKNGKEKSKKTNRRK